MHRFTLSLLLLCLAGCERPAPAPPATERVSTYEARGVLRKATADRAIIAHEAIPGYMEAMTMEFTVADPRELTAMHPGDTIAFRLTATDERSWIDRIRPLAAAPTSPAPAAEVPALPPGAQLPDCALVDSRGAALQLRDFQGRALAITFIFTRCPLPDFCPRLNSHFAAVQRALAAGPATNWHLLSLTLDPDFDTPARLADYATRFQPDAARWTFATGARAEIEKLGAAVGLQVARTGALPDHNLRTIVIDPTGRVRRVFTGNEWTPEELVAELQRAMASGS